MYQPPHFREDRLDLQHALIRANPLGILVTVGEQSPIANHIPCVLDADASPFGTLRCHVARANDVWHTLDGASEALVIFQGVDGYVTPAWYETKRETGKVVPTWNYVVVHAYGRPRAIENPAWLMRQLADLTAQNEAGRAEPWQVSDAPDEFIAAQMKGIIGIEIEITRIEAKWKVSQNRNLADRVGVAHGLRSQGDERSLALAELVAKGSQ